MRIDAFNWIGHATVDKYEPDAGHWAAARLGIVSPTAADFDALGIRPYETVDGGENLLTTAGLTRLTSLLIGAGGQAMTNTATRLGVGNGGTAAAVGDVDLSAAAGTTNRLFRVMDATFPSVAAGVVTAKSSFADAEANFVWSEWGIDIGTPTVTTGATVNAVLLNHKSGAALGTKTSGVWALTVTITFT
jgi:hypothetical protein